MTGDCKLLEKIYKNLNNEYSFTFDRKNSRVTYHNELNETITENKELFGRKLANNLQNSYLKGINFLIQRNLNRKLDPNKFLDEYDLMTWNNHIYQLSNATHQRKIMGQLNIQIKSK